MATKILTVDDSKTIRLIVIRAFKEFDCVIFEASNGVEGLAAASREKPDVIILDYTMPMMDGGEMLAKLKSNPDLKSIPVVMLTAEAGRETVFKLAKLGVRDYCVKPFREEVVVEKVSRIVNLRPKGETAAKQKRYDDPLSILVVDDKPAIPEQIRAGLADTKWVIEERGQTGQAVDSCTQKVPDVVLISLTLPEDSGYTLFQILRAGVKTKNVPVFALSVKTAVDEQARAQQLGFTGVITKPIDFADLKLRITRTLALDTSYKYFEQKDGVMVLRLPPTFSQSIANEINTYLRVKLAEAVDAGLDSLIIDFSEVKSADVTLIKLGLSVVQLCKELSMKHSTIGSEAVSQECKHYEETKDWRFFTSFKEAVDSLNSKALAA
ncbi:MAG: response regulator [Verrucomicrobiia bacterium]